MEIKDLSYKIMIDDDNKMQYFLNDEPWEFVDPSTVNIGDIIYFDPNGLERYGIVMNIRHEDFTYFDVNRGFTSSNSSQIYLEEIAMFQVYKVDKAGLND